VKRFLVLVAVVAISVPFGIPTASAIRVPLGGTAGKGGFRVAPVGGVRASLKPTKLPGGAAGVRVEFQKSGEERRLVALEAPVSQLPTGIHALTLKTRLRLTKGEAPRLALVVYEKDGGAWFKVGSNPLPTAEVVEVRLPVGRLTRAAFSRDDDDQVGWNQVDRMWLGLVFDGPAAGAWEVGAVRLTDEPYHPTRPLRITGDGPGKWTVGKDPAAKATATTPNEGPDGKPCLRFDFTFPGGRHMYALPTTPVPAAELEGYRALRFRYKATVPQGLKGLLVTLHEQSGGQYYVEPPPSADWTTLEVPFTKFKRAGWAKDPNGKFDLNQVNAITIGTHGTATKGGSGTIWAADIEFVP